MSQERLLEGGLLSWIKKDARRRSLPQWEGHSSQRGSMSQSWSDVHDSRAPRLEVSVWVRKPVP